MTHVLLLALLAAALPLVCVVPAPLDRMTLRFPAAGEGTGHGHGMTSSLLGAVPSDLALRLRGGKMKNEAAEKRSLKHQRTLARKNAGVSGGVQKGAPKSKTRQTRKKFGKAGKGQKQEQGAQKDDDPAPRIVAIIPLSKSASADVAMERLLTVSCVIVYMCTCIFVCTYVHVDVHT